MPLLYKSSVLNARPHATSRNLKSQHLLQELNYLLGGTVDTIPPMGMGYCQGGAKTLLQGDQSSCPPLEIKDADKLVGK